jgi:DNA adenine methylase
MRRRNRKSRPDTLIPRFGGKKNLIKPISREIFNCRRQNYIDTYAEIFGGGARVLLNIANPTTTIFNEYNPNICALFKVVRQGGETLDRLVTVLQELEYCKENYIVARKLAQSEDADEFDRAMAAYILAKWSIVNAWGSFKHYTENTPETWIKCHRINLAVKRGYYSNIHHLYWFHHRLQGVDIVCGDYKNILLKYQNCETALIYADPPYYDRDDYDSGWNAADQEEMISIFLECTCKVILSGYDTSLYNERLADSEAINSNGWKRKDLGEFAVRSARSGMKKHEYLWVNYQDRAATSVHKLSTDKS